jgi:enterochelin esterase-like enzyme
VTDPPASPRLAALQADLAAGDRAALERFWAEVEAQGTPLIEPLLPGDDAHALVTFLWREGRHPGEPAPLRTVVVVSLLTGPDLPAHRLRRLPGTDLWHRSYRVRTDVRTTYWLEPGDAVLSLYDRDRERANERLSALRRRGGIVPDPLNRQPFPERGPPVMSGVVLPAPAPQPWLAARAGVPAGTVERHRFRSAVLGNERDVWLYTPPGAGTAEAAGAPPPLLVLFDGKQYVDWMAAPTTLDNLTAAGALPPVVAVFVGNVRRLQELGGAPAFVEFLTHELAPWARARAGATADPAQTVLAGASLGGFAAALAALRRPDVFGNVLAQSGGFGWRPEGEREWGWLLREFEERPRVPVRFWLDVGRFETFPLLGPRPGDDGPGQLAANRRLRDVLRAKGYAVRYAEFAGGHDVIWWRGTLADGLLALLGPPTDGAVDTTPTPDRPAVPAAPE